MNWTCSICGSNDVARQQRMNSRFELFRKRKLVTCANCSGKTVHPVPNELELAEINRTYWESTGTGGAGARKGLLELARHRVDYLLKHCGSLEGKRVLDIGSGHAYPYDAMNSLDIRANYSAVESDEEMRKELTAKGITAYADLHDVKGQSFDLVILSHVVEHVECPAEFLKSASECLSDEGTMYVEVPNQDDLFKLDLGLHLAVYNPGAMAILCESAGLYATDLSTAGVSIDELRPSVVSRIEHKLKLTNSLAYRCWRRARKAFPLSGQPVDMNAVILREDNDGRWLRVLARKRAAA
jgi:SAM-dependent methyltransferase